jgi:aspartyl-tRNA(Asn)/glutamyl-tRNA(Gln) amidotransferase subunit C
MRIDAAEVRRLAGLARLRVEDEELARLSDQLSAVLSHLDRLARVAPALPEPRPGEPVEASRSDEPTPSLDRGVVASLAPRWQTPYVLAPPSPVLRRDGGGSR